MADNRMYLRCKGCGGCILLAKQFGLNWEWNRFNSINTLNDYFDWHIGCVDDRPAGDFELLYETEDDFNEKYKDWRDDLNVGDQS